MSVESSWEWRRRYRVWEADRKVFLFPENWIEPEERLSPRTEIEVRDVARVAHEKRTSVMLTSTTPEAMLLIGRALATSLEKDLYRVDLRAVISKFIGETEKNLDLVFAAAAKASAVLLFDEADALFGTRSETADSHDRFANAEVRFLLERIEDLDGLAVLATNSTREKVEPLVWRFAFVIEPVTKPRR